MLPNWESGPQNQPSANVAISVLTGSFASPDDSAIAGVVVFFWKAMVPPLLKVTTAVILIINPRKNRGTNITFTFLYYSGTLKKM